MRLDGRVYFPHSLGIFYLAITQYLGFPKYGDEYKVMGLAPYGSPTRMEEMRRVLRTFPGGEFRLDLEFFRHHREDLAYRWEAGSPTVERHYTDALEELLGPARLEGEELDQRHFDVARSAQARFEEAVLELLRALHARYGLDAVVVSGGAAMNSVANGKVTRGTPFAKVFAPPAPGDAGGAVGAALVAWREASGGSRPDPMIHSYYGPGYGRDRLREVLDGAAGELGACEVHEVASEETLCDEIAGRIADTDDRVELTYLPELLPRARWNGDGDGEGADVIIAMGFESPYQSRVSSVGRFAFQMSSIMTNNLLRASFAFHGLAHHGDHLAMSGPRPLQGLR